MIKPEDKNRTSPDNDFDGQLIYGISGGIKSADNSHAFEALEGELAKLSLPLPADWSVAYPPVFFLKNSQRDPVTLRVGGGSLAMAITAEKSDERYVQYCKDNGLPVKSDSTGPRFDKMPYLYPMLHANQMEILDIIYDGRIRIVVLLNSLGGDVGVGKNIIGLFDHVREKGGIVDVYVSSFAASMAAGIFERADNKFALNDSAMMWHSARPDLDSPLMPLAEAISGPVDTEERRKKAMEAHRESFSDFVARAVIAEKRDELMAAFDRECSDRENNPLGETWLSGGQLSEYGIATRTFDGLGDMERFFLERTRLDPDVLFREDSYFNRFFSVSAFEEQIRKRCGLSVKVEEESCNWHVAGIFAKESSAFSVGQATRENLDKAMACVSEILGSSSPDLAGHNLRVAERS